MKSLTFLIMLLLTSNLLLSQTTNISRTQVNEIYKGLKQNEYLKERLQKTEATLNSSSRVIEEQKTIIGKQNQMIILKDEQLAGLKSELDLNVKAKDIEIKRLNDLAEVNLKVAKKNARKSFWRGFIVGGISVSVAGFATIILLN